MNLFPFLKETEQNLLITPKLHKEYDFDFSNGQLTGKVLEGKEALKVWIYKTLLTKRYKHIIYSWDYGQDLEEIIGQGYEKGLIRSEVERRIKDCLLIHPHIKECNSFNITLQQDKLNVDFIVNTIYGEVDINVPNI
ncbi:DUF2634 domain-containing protein [Zhenhengia yiwuensis]|uniref:DUF2634 domain-containing protein n=1 Tax=Zhenhengia yiwuensis TaxID=2763666 RepID=A0A926EK52_9FIRM|nr:DUF2634 domain-containing protein [Zhenhengia yiwuensis]MBC8580005.1 DUF2634 domain-containing protein [Zhenhengia yiwuensis]